jgi:hypothetical protein
MATYEPLWAPIVLLGAIPTPIDPGRSSVTPCRLYKITLGILVVQMWEQMITSEVLMSCIPHLGSTRTLVVETSFHMYVNENPKLKNWL